MFVLIQPLRGVFPLSLANFRSEGLVSTNTQRNKLVEVYEKHFSWKGGDDASNPGIVQILIDKSTGEPFRALLTTTFADVVFTLNEYGIPTSITLSANEALIKQKLEIERLDVRADIGEDGRVLNIERYCEDPLEKAGKWISVDDPSVIKVSSLREKFEIILIGLHMDIYKNDILMSTIQDIRNRQANQKKHFDD